ncbi:MAG: flagellar motor protein MotA [Gammaproteobacteria bacterium]
MTQPSRSLLWMAVFVGLVLIGLSFITGPLVAAFLANPWFNGVILAVLAVGLVIDVRQVLSLYPEIAWAEAWRQGEQQAAQAAQPRLLASMALMLSGRGDISLSATSLRTLLDSIRTRLEESRDLSRYFIGVLVFLGLLGTFWGLMATVGSVAGVIRGMAVDGADGATIFADLKANLEGPLGGMGVAFSSSLFGLAGSLVLGFLDLQAGHAQNRFVNELEEWLSGSTRLSSGLMAEEGFAGGAPAYVEALLEKTADSLERMQRASRDDDALRERLHGELATLGDTLTRFGRALGEQNERLARLGDGHAELAAALNRLAQARGDAPLNDELREELRLLSRTVANALKARAP